MSVESVKEYFDSNGIDATIKFFDDTSTVDKAAEALEVAPGEIAKSLLFKLRDDDYIMIITAGDKRIDNRKYKDIFSCKSNMASPKEVLEVTGHPIGGVCPFGLKEPIKIYLDESLKDYDVIYPAAGEANAAVKISIEYLSKLTGNRWVDVSGD